MKTLWVLYTFGNGDAIRLAFSGLQALTTSALFGQLVTVSMLFGFGWLLLSSVAQGRLLITPLIQYLLFSTLLVQLCLRIKTTVGIVDILDPAHNRVVTQIPWLIGVPGAILSQLGYRLAKQIDVTYSQAGQLPPSLSLTGANNGLTTGGSGAPQGILAQLLYDANHYHIHDTYLKNSLTHFFVDCAMGAISAGRLPYAQWLHTDHLWKLLGQFATNPALMTVYYGTASGQVHSTHGLIKTCRMTYTLLDQDLHRLQASHFPGWQHDMDTQLWHRLFETTLQYIASRQAYISTPGQYIQQAALLNLLSGPVIRRLSQVSEGPALIQALARAQSQRATSSHWLISYSVFQATFGYLYAALQVLTYALSPIILMIALLPGLRKTILTRYLQLLVWFPMTFILLAIANDSMTLWSQSLLSAAWKDGGLSLSSAPFISAAVSKSLLVGGWLMTCVPLLSWSLVTGMSIGMSHLLGATSLHGLHRTSALQAATGNMQLDEQHYDNTTAHQFNTAAQTTIGALPTTLHTASTALLHDAHLGGLSVSAQGAFNMRAITETTTQTQQAYIGTTDTTQLSNTHQETLQITDRPISDNQNDTESSYVTDAVSALASSAIGNYLNTLGLDAGGPVLSMVTDKLSSMAASLADTVSHASLGDLSTDSLSDIAHSTHPIGANLREVISLLQAMSADNPAIQPVVEELMAVGIGAAAVAVDALVPEAIGEGAATVMAHLGSRLASVLSSLPTPAAAIATTGASLIAAPAIANTSHTTGSASPLAADAITRALEAQGFTGEKLTQLSDHAKSHLAHILTPRNSTAPNADTPSIQEDDSQRLSETVAHIHTQTEAQQQTQTDQARTESTQSQTQKQSSTHYVPSTRYYEAIDDHIEGEAP